MTQQGTGGLPSAPPPKRGPQPNPQGQPVPQPPAQQGGLPSGPRQQSPRGPLPVQPGVGGALPTQPNTAPTPTPTPAPTPAPAPPADVNPAPYPPAAPPPAPAWATPDPVYDDGYGDDEYGYVPPAAPPVTPPAPRPRPASSPMEYYDQAMNGQPPVMVMDEEAQPRKRFGLGGGKGKSSPKEKAAKPGKGSGGGALAGGRLWIVVARFGILGVIALLVLLGVVSIATPRTDQATMAALEELQSSVGYGGFPLTAASTLGADFVNTYFQVSSNPEANVQRMNTLEQLAPSVNSTSFQLNRSVEQNVVQSARQYQAPEYLSPNSVTFFYSILVETPDPNAKKPEAQQPDGEITEPPMIQQWYYVAVPMYADDEGNVTIAGQIAYMPSPVTPELGVDTLVAENDLELSTQLSETLLVPFFTDWAASDETRLKLVVYPDGSEPAAWAGLGGTVEFAGLSSVYIPKIPETADPTLREAYVDVNWKQANGLTVSQSYKVSLYIEANKWWVWDIQPDNRERVPAPAQP